MEDTILRVEGLTKTFRSTKRDRVPITAVNNVSFSLYRGKVLGLVGESGSGKTTIGRILTGIDAPTSGTLEWSSIVQNTVRTPKRSGRRVQMVFQDPYAALNPFNSVDYALTRPLINFLGIKSADAREQARQLLETVRLTPPSLYANKRPHELSGGQRQRVVIARALAAAPDVIIADEPVSMLYVSIMADVLLLHHDIYGTKTIEWNHYITHDLLSARLLANYVMVLYKGRSVEIGPTDAILGNPLHPYTRLLLSSIPNPRQGRDKPEASSMERLVVEDVPTSGCPFAPRCPLAVERCNREVPLLREDSVGRSVACHMVAS